MQNDSSPKINPFIALAVVFQFIFIVFAIVTLNNLLAPNNKSPIVKIDDYAAVSNSATLEGSLGDIQDDHKSIIGTTIYNIAALNTSQNINSFGAKIRDDSVSNIYIDELGMHYMHFIVDIEDLGQSYQVVYRWVENPPDDIDVKDIPLVTAFCPKSEDLIYGDFNCQDSYSGNAEAQIIYETLQYKDLANSRISLIGDPSLGENLTISILTRSDDENTTSAAIEEIAEFIGLLGFALEDYDYAASTCGVCGPQD